MELQEEWLEEWEKELPEEWEEPEPEALLEELLEWEELEWGLGMMNLH